MNVRLFGFLFLFFVLFCTSFVRFYQNFSVFVFLPFIGAIEPS